MLCKDGGLNEKLGMCVYIYIHTHTHTHTHNGMETIHFRVYIRLKLKCDKVSCT